MSHPTALRTEIEQELEREVYLSHPPVARAPLEAVEEARWGEAVFEVTATHAAPSQETTQSSSDTLVTCEGGNGGKQLSTASQ
mgnify:CR=1 FL=1